MLTFEFQPPWFQTFSSASIQFRHGDLLLDTLERSYTINICDRRSRKDFRTDGHGVSLRIRTTHSNASHQELLEDARLRSSPYAFHRSDRHTDEDLYVVTDCQRSASEDDQFQVCGRIFLRCRRQVWLHMGLETSLKCTAV
jgi:hypothetical protein